MATHTLQVKDPTHLLGEVRIAREDRTECCQGRIGSSLSQRHTVLVADTRHPSRVPCLVGYTALFHRARGAPRVVGISQASGRLNRL